MKRTLLEAKSTVPDRSFSLATKDGLDYVQYVVKKTLRLVRDTTRVVRAEVVAN